MQKQYDFSQGIRGAVANASGKTKQTCFEVDKSQPNRKKHGIDLDNALEVFNDPLAIRLEDRYYNEEGEEGYVAIGMDGIGQLLFVVYNYQNDSLIKLISARLADPSERRVYGE